MKRVILSSKVDEIRKAQAEWEAESARRDALNDVADAKYDKAKSAVFAPIEDYIRSGLKKFNLLDFQIAVSVGSRFQSRTGCVIKVWCNQHTKFEDSTALAWDYEAALNEDGTIAKESSSWSGLKACTEDQMNSLRQTVGALEFLNSIDYTELLDVELPNRSDYFEKFEDRGPKPDFKSQLKLAELEEFIGKNIFLKGSPLYEDPEYNGYPTLYYLILGETEKQYKFGRLDNWAISHVLSSGKSFDDLIKEASTYTRRARKDRVLDALDYPFSTFDSIEDFNQSL